MNCTVQLYCQHVWVCMQVFVYELPTSARFYRIALGMFVLYILHSNGLSPTNSITWAAKSISMYYRCIKAIFSSAVLLF